MIVLAAAVLILAGHGAEGSGMALGWLFATVTHYEDRP
jgi:hypothetical protein